MGVNHGAKEFEGRGGGGGKRLLLKVNFKTLMLWLQPIIWDRFTHFTKEDDFLFFITTNPLPSLSNFSLEEGVVNKISYISL